MKLQITLDLLDLEEAMDYLQEICEYADIIEIGTPLSMKYGFEAIRTIREAYPDLTILDDVKIVDGGKKLTNAILSEEADIVTVLGVSDKSTLRDAIQTAKGLGKQVMIDTIGITDLSEALKELDELGADYLSVHTGVDEQKRGITSIKKLEQAKRACKNTAVAVAGGISLNELLEEYLSLKPDVLIVGTGIFNAENRRETAKAIHEKVHRGEV